jgi:hypothetical protein
VSVAGRHDCEDRASKTSRDQLEPIRAFVIGVAVNVPVGNLSTAVFPRFWSNISSLM